MPQTTPNARTRGQEADIRRVPTLLRTRRRSPRPGARISPTQRCLNHRCHRHRRRLSTGHPRGRRIGETPAPRTHQDLRQVETPLEATTSLEGEQARPNTATGRADASPTLEKGTGRTRATETDRTPDTIPHLPDHPDIAGKEGEEAKAVAAITTTTSL